MHRCALFPTRDEFLASALYSQVCPRIFTQLFTIHGTFRGAAFPFVYALLPNKTQESYTTIMDVVVTKCRELRLNPNPDTVISDFEQGIINAVSAVFPAADLRLCLFHLGQSVYRHVQSEGLQQAYSDPQHREVKIGVHMLISVAFVPNDDVVAVFEQVLYSSVESIPRGTAILRAPLFTLHSRFPRPSLII